MFDSQKELENILQALVASLDISESNFLIAEKRYKSVASWLERDASTVKVFSPDCYTQGSFRLGTIIKPIVDEHGYDIDFVCKLDLTKSQLSQEELKTLLGYEIELYAKANKMKSDPEEGKRCWTLHYADVDFHLDLLPSIPDGDSYRQLLENKGHFSTQWTDDAIAISDNTLENYKIVCDEWPSSNPIGYSNWFKEQMREQFDESRRILAESTLLSVEEIPVYKIKTTLQRSIQILKRHRDIMFEDDQDDKPISIIITTLAAHAYRNENNIVDALTNIINQIPNYINNQEGNIIWIPNPVNPLENFADKWEKHPQRKDKFYQWLITVKKDIERALIVTNDQDLIENLGLCFGDKIIKSIASNYSSKQQISVKPSFLSLLNVNHAKPLKWPIRKKGSATISATFKKNERSGPITLNSNQGLLTKNGSLRFKVFTDISQPYTAHWQVVNTGRDAIKANCLRGGFYSAEEDGSIRNESTSYKGSHWVKCFIVKEGNCVAVSDEFIIHID